VVFRRSKFRLVSPKLIGTLKWISALVVVLRHL